MRFLALLSFLLFTLPSLADEPAAQAGQVPGATQDFTVQDRGPIHEAFARPDQPNAAPAPAVQKAPPPPVPEEPPDQKPQGNNVQWIPGYWSWDPAKNDYLWISGVWREVPPGRNWTPGYWNKVGNDYQWVPGFWGAAQAQQQPQPQFLPQPPASLDMGPNGPAPDPANNFWIPGNWVYRPDGYVWQPGFWTQLHPGWVWVASTYNYTPSGYVFVPGYWDYPLDLRGLLFAPVYFHRPVWGFPGYVYRPGFVVGVNGFFGSLFVRSGYGHYYYGNYYSGAYAGLGFSPWHSYSRRSYDSLYTYYDRVNYRNPGWSAGLYRQGVSIQAATALAAASGTRAPRSASLVQPINNVQIQNRSLTRINQTQVNEQRIASQQIRDASNQRAQRERLANPATFPQQLGPRYGRTDQGNLDPGAARAREYQNWARDNQLRLEQSLNQRRSLYVNPQSGNPGRDAGIRSAPPGAEIHPRFSPSNMPQYRDGPRYQGGPTRGNFIGAFPGGSTGRAPGVGHVGGPAPGRSGPPPGHGHGHDGGKGK